MKRVKQGNASGCGLACVAMLANKKYEEIRELAKEILNFNNDHDLYTDTTHLRKLLLSFGIVTSSKKVPFTEWGKLPKKAILGINHDMKTDKWHWVVYQRDDRGASVLDPKVTIKTDRRTDFSRMRPKWYISIHG